MNKNVALLYESLSKGDYEIFKKLCAPAFIDYSATQSPFKSSDSTTHSYKTYNEMFPDLNIKVNSITIDGKRALVETTTTGTNTGKVLGFLPPSGKKVIINNIDVITFDAGGKILSRLSTNPNEIFRQIGYSAVINSNTLLVLGIYNNFMKRNIVGVLDACDENIAWDVRDNPFIKDPIIFKGKSGVTKFFEQVASSGQVIKFEPVKYFADGDDVLLLLDTIFKPTGSTQNMESEYAHRFTFKDDKLINFKQYTTKPRIANWQIPN
ncbi:MAG: nuclear transport factor 2 family protein [Proteobacteria bacterium]|nr:nuclear transport factor 2 family protein [Pseudomonadota bacterium]